MHFPNVVAINSPANSTCSSSNDNSVSTNSRLSSSSSSSSTPTNKNDLLNAAAAAAAYSRLPQLQDFQQQQQQQQQQQHPQIGYPDYSQFSGQIPNNGYSAAAAAAAYAYLDPLALAASGCYPPYPTQQSGSNGCYQANDGTRRKNATRETTATLKAWLYEHRKNPYPTKGEKIMLAIITKMTLNQVSTWFANARRRLKKENKMSFSPRNK